MEMRILCLLMFVCIGRGARSLWKDICKENTQNECKCYKEVDREKLHFTSKSRKLPTTCQQPCDMYPCCNGGIGKLCRRDIGDACTGITIVTRQQWNASSPRGPIGTISKAVSMFYIHHTDGPECYDEVSCGKVLRAIQRYHFSLHWNDIGYSFLIGEDGKVYEGRGWNKVGAHTEGYNSVSYGTAIMGNFTSKLPNQKALSATKQLIACGVQKGEITPVYSLYGHRDAEGDTACPGDDLYKEIQGWKNFNRTANPSAGCVARGRRCRHDKSMCKPGSLIVGPSLCLGAYKTCCYKP